jgi:hypothetical protein
MKKFVLAAILLAGASVAFVGCNNGAYDMDTAVNNPALNPLDPSSGVTVYLGTMKAKVNGTPSVYYPATYTNPADKQFVITALRGEDKFPQHTITMGIFGFENINEFSSSFTYSFKDTTMGDTLTIVRYEPKDGEPMKIKMTGNESNNFRGTFEGKVYRKFPIADMNDYIEFAEGEFYVPKGE